MSKEKLLFINQGTFNFQPSLNLFEPYVTFLNFKFFKYAAYLLEGDKVIS